MFLRLMINFTRIMMYGVQLYPNFFGKDMVYIYIVYIHVLNLSIANNICDYV